MPMPRSVPAMVKRPRENSMSAAAASSRWAASLRPFSMTTWLASTIALPLCMIEREPPVPPPAMSWSLSPCSSRILSNGMPSAIDQHLRERRGVALAVVERAGDDRDRAVRLEADAAHLWRWRARSLRDSGRCRARAACRACGSPRAASENASHSAAASAFVENRPGNRRCRIPSPTAPCRASCRARCGCAGAARRGRCPSRARPCRPCAPCSSCPRAGRRRDRRRPARCW